MHIRSIGVGYMQTGPGVGQLASLASFEGFGKDCVAVVVMSL